MVGESTSIVTQITPATCVDRLKSSSMGILAVSVSAARRLGEIGFLVGALGALLLVLEAARPGSPETQRRMARLIGALLIAVGFALGILYVHWG